MIILVAIAIFSKYYYKQLLSLVLSRHFLKQAFSEVGNDCHELTMNYYIERYAANSGDLIF